MHYFEESFRYFPSNFDNLIVLGFLYFRDEIYEKAIQFFELATKVQPYAVKILFIFIKHLAFNS
jgi:intraflagellar transport protein 88